MYRTHREKMKACFQTGKYILCISRRGMNDDSEGDYLQKAGFQQSGEGMLNLMESQEEGELVEG